MVASDIVSDQVVPRRDDFLVYNPKVTEGFWDLPVCNVPKNLPTAGRVPRPIPPPALPVGFSDRVNVPVPTT
jgi:hypothetical protein